MNYQCARCGWDVGNGGAHSAVIVTRITDQGDVEVFRFCRDSDDGKVKHRGCEHRVLSPSNLKYVNESQEDKK